MIRRRLSGRIIELAIGVLLLLAIVAMTILWMPSPDDSTAQLNQYAADTAEILVNEPIRGSPGTRNAATLEARADALLPDHLEYQIIGPAGIAGQRPTTTRTGTAMRPTPHGELRVIVWYGR